MTDQPGGVQLSRIERDTVTLGIKGTAPLICNQWDEKAKAMMLDAQMGRKNAKQFKDPQAQYEATIYRFVDGRAGFPVVAFKAATVGAARYFDGVAMTELRRSLFFHGEGPEQLVRLNGDPVMREDMVRVGRGVADIRYRAMFPDWTATLTITYLPTMLTLESVVALVNAGGMGGVGEWRPSKSDSGMYGTYEVVEQPVEQVGRSPQLTAIALAQMEREWRQLRRKYEAHAVFWQLVQKDLPGAA